MRKLAFLLIVLLAFCYGICNHQQKSNNYKNEEYNADFQPLYLITQQSISRYYKFKCTEPGLYANVKHCRIYYKCVRAGHKHRLRKSVHKCKIGTVFSYILNGICTLPAESERVECGGYSQSTDNYSSATEQTTTTNDLGVENEKEITLQIDSEINLKDLQHDEKYKSDKLKMPISSSSKKSKRHVYESRKSNESKDENHESNENEVTTHLILTEEQIKETKENLEFEVTTPKISHKEHEDSVSDIMTFQISIMEQTESERDAKPEITILKISQEEEEEEKIQSDGAEVTTVYILTEGQTKREESTEPDITTTEVHLEKEEEEEEKEQKRHESGKLDETTLHDNIPEEQTESEISTELEITTLQIPNKEDESNDGNTKIEMTTDISTNKIESNIDYSDRDRKSSTTQIPNVPNKKLDDEIVNLRCMSAGFFPEPSDCTKFYRCVRFGAILRKYNFVCPEGTIWDQRIMTCNFASVKNISCKRKIKDLSDLPYEITDKYQKIPTTIIEFPISTKIPAISTVPPEVIYPVVVKNSTTTEDQSPFICPTGFRRHPKYCNLFYQCTVTNNTETKIVVFKCSVGTIFNDKKIRCVRESKVREIPYGYVNCKKFNSLLPDISVANLSVPAIRLCPGEGRYPYHKNCSSIYYDCKRDSHGILQGYLLNCPDGLIYSNILRRCKQTKYFPMCALSSSSL